MGVVANVPPEGTPAPVVGGPAPDPAGAGAVGEPDPPDGKIELFSLDGVSYYVPESPGPNVALRYMRDIRNLGQQAASYGLLERLVGTDAMNALTDYDDLTDEDLETVMAAVHRHVLGPLEAKGKGLKTQRAGKR